MQIKNTFLPHLPFLIMALLLAATIGCKDDDDTKSTTCTTYSDLGEFSANFEIPYADTLQTFELVSEEDSTGLVAVNHPLDFEFFGIFPTTTTYHVFDCEAFNSVEEYVWHLTSQLTVINVVVDNSGSAPFFLIKETPLVDDTKPKDGPIGNFLEFYAEDEFSGLVKDNPFMLVMTQELQAGKGGEYEGGFTLLDSITIKGETFEQVYTNTESLTGKVRHIYYSRSLGLVGVEDEHHVRWRVGQ